LKSLIDGLLDALRRNLYFHSALERADRFYRDLHFSTSKIQDYGCGLEAGAGRAKLPVLASVSA
jgi:hypothetical protein